MSVPVVQAIGGRDFGTLASLIGVLVLVLLFLFVRRGIRIEKERQIVSPAQAQLHVDEWVNVWSAARRQRVRSKLPTPDDESLPEERFLRVSGQSRALLVLQLCVPSLLIVLSLAALAWLSTRPAVVATPVRHHHRHHRETIHAPISFHLSDTAFVHDVLLAVVVLALLAIPIIIGLWSGVYFVLSDYRFYRVWVYHPWLFWRTIEPQEIELHMLTTKGLDLNLFQKMFGRFGTLILDTAGAADARFFNSIQWVPDVEEFAKKISNVRRAAMPPAEGEHMQRLTEAVQENTAVMRQYLQHPSQTRPRRQGPAVDPDDTQDLT